MTKPWRHQQEAYRVATEMAKDKIDRSLPITLDWTPGSGKTKGALFVIKALLEQKAVDRVLVVTPRTSLAEQFRGDFVEAEINLGKGLRLVDENVQPFVREFEKLECIGYVTTYQLLSQNVDLHVKEVESGRKRWLVVLDEAAHLAKNREWHAKVDRIMQAKQVRFKTIMTGAIERWDGDEIPYVIYEDREGKRFPSPWGWSALIGWSGPVVDYARVASFDPRERGWTAAVDSDAREGSQPSQ